MNDDSIRVLIVDDTAMYRKILRDLLSESAGIEVVGIAQNGEIALEKIAALKPDVVTLDLEMPVMNGIQVLRQLQKSTTNTSVIVLSALSDQGAAITLTALQLGAVDFCLKPSGGSLQENLATLRAALIPKIETFGRKMRKITRRPPRSTAARMVPPLEPRPKIEPVRPRPQLRRRPAARPEVVAIGVSTGGPQALAAMLPKLPSDFPVPVLVVQHMPPLFTRSLADSLGQKCGLTVCEAQDGQAIQAGTVYIAPGGHQMKIARSGAQVVTRMTDDPPEHSCRPAVDYLFRSIATVYGGNVLAVIMTGMGHDGAAGCRLLKEQGATVFAQDEASCVVYGMPRIPVEEGIADKVVPLERLALELRRAVQEEVAACR